MIDVEALFAENEARLEHLYSDGGVLPALFARLGVYAFHPLDESGYHDWKSVGWPVYRMRKDRIPLDPTLRFDEYAMLVPCGPSIREAIAKHPSTPRAVLEQMKTMGARNEPLDLSQVHQTPLPRIEAARTPLNATWLAHVLAVCEAKGSREELGGSEGALVRRAGGYDYAYEVVIPPRFEVDDPTTEHRPVEPLDPTLPSDELAQLQGHGAFAEQLVANHPATKRR